MVKKGGQLPLLDRSLAVAPRRIPRGPSVRIKGLLSVRQSLHNASRERNVEEGTNGVYP
jgi:hypothetical protein